MMVENLPQIRTRLMTTHVDRIEVHLYHVSDRDEERLSLICLILPGNRSPCFGARICYYIHRFNRFKYSLFENGSLFLMNIINKHSKIPNTF